MTPIQKRPLKRERTARPERAQNRTHEQNTSAEPHETTHAVPEAAKKLRIIPVGGCEEVGRNMTALEYGNDTILIDMGLQFPEENMPGIDYIIPNMSYFIPKRKDIRGVGFSPPPPSHTTPIPPLIFST